MAAHFRNWSSREGVIEKKECRREEKKQQVAGVEACWGTNNAIYSALEFAH
jgi:hypothetical protein